MFYLSDVVFGTKRWVYSCRNCLMVLGFSLLLVIAQAPSARGDGADYAKTRYPIVMVPGAFAFDSILGVVDYWFRITDELRQQGSDVYVTTLSNSASNLRRGEELLEDIRKIRALTGASKVNLIAHSQGGPSARYVAGIKPEWIESVSCVTCMNEGTEFADNLYLFLNKHRFLKSLVNVVFSSIFSALDVFSSTPKDGTYNSPGRGLQIAEDLIKAAGTQALRDFNQKFPEALSARSCESQDNGSYYQAASGLHTANGVSYFSWGGTKSVTNYLDPIDSIMVPVVKIFYPRKARVWDGLVRSCGHPLGTMTEGFYPLNHFDAINQAFGIIGSGIDIPTLYALNVNRLHGEGH